MLAAALTNPHYITRKSSWVTHIPFAFAAAQMLRPRTFVELGVYWGDSYCAFCQAFAKFSPQTQAAGIDTWQGDSQQGSYGPEVLAKLRAHHDPRYAAFSRLIQSTFDQALDSFSDGAIDLLHIDGFHSYAAVRRDFESWRPKVSDRGVVLFHDTAVTRPGFGVRQLWEEISPRFPSFAFTHGSGLGILAVGSQVPAPFRRFLSRANRTPHGCRALYRLMGYRIRRLRPRPKATP